ncbi:MAG: hypothetical protein K2W88_15085 [Pararheinheimera sp.]|nr:hypothetical protein [Rheinheimera sp.]
MSESIHRLTGTYCPYCLNPVIEVIATGYQLCISAGYPCEYKVAPGGTQPFSAELFNELQLIESDLREAKEIYKAMRLAAIERHRKMNTKQCSSNELQSKEVE